MRTTQTGADEIAIDAFFERLTHIENFPAGHRQDARVTLKVEQSPFGQNAWSTVLVRTFTGRQMTPLFWGHRWRPGGSKTVLFGERKGGIPAAGGEARGRRGSRPHLCRLYHGAAASDRARQAKRGDRS